MTTLLNDPNRAILGPADEQNDVTVPALAFVTERVARSELARFDAVPLHRVDYVAWRRVIPRGRNEAATIGTIRSFAAAVRVLMRLRLPAVANASVQPRVRHRQTVRSSPLLLGDRRGEFNPRNTALSVRRTVPRLRAIADGILQAGAGKARALADAAYVR